MPTPGPRLDAVRWERARAVFDRCVDLDEHERASILEEAERADAEMASAVAALLRAHDAMPHTQDDRVALGIERSLATFGNEPATGQRFGAFRVASELARGGMGVVYLAERDDGTVAQRVALKLVGSAHFGPASSMRLAREYRMLAALEHPYIARLIDAGAREDGSAYFAMEYVEGTPITRHCDDLALANDARLRLFLQVCSAVQFAHAKLIVHRDLKAANILVSKDGLPKLLDFGIATSLDDGAAAEPHERFLTLYSAAPEQFHGDETGIATDVYALGVLLCELTAGERPIDVEGVDANEAQRRVTHEPPRLPSTLVTDDAARRRGGANANALRRSLQGDDAIAAHCLEKEPQRRYASVAALADDVERHLARRPISIRAHERGYRAQRFVRRHAVAVGFGALAAALLVGFVAYGIVTNHELARQRDEARMREQQAVFQRGRAEAVTDFLVGLFRSTAPEQTRGHDVSARELVDKGRAGVEAGLAAQPDLKAAMLSALSDVYLAFDDLDTAERLARSATVLRESTPSSDPMQRASALLQTAVIANRRGRPVDALAALDSATRLVAAPDAGMRSRLLEGRAEALQALARAKEAVPLLEEDVDMVTTAYGEDDPRTLRATMNLAATLRGVGRVDDAQALLARSLPRMRRSLAPDDPDLAETLAALATYARNHGSMDEAEPLAKEALELTRRIYGENSSHTSRTVSLLATIESALGRDAQARGLFERSLAIVVAIYGADSTQAASAEFNLGSQLQIAGGHVDEALAHLQRAVAIAAKRWPPDHVNPAIFRISLGSSLRERGRHAEAETVLRQALGVFEANPAPRGLNIALARGELACNEVESTGSAEAIAALETAMAALRRIAPDEPSVRRLDQCAARARRSGVRYR